MAMTENHKTALKKNRMILLDQLQLDSMFMSYFQREEILTNTEVGKIMEPQNYTNRERVRMLIDKLQIRGDIAFTCLIEALVETSQEHLAEVLDPGNPKVPPADEVDYRSVLFGNEDITPVNRTHIEKIIQNINDPKAAVRIGTTQSKLQAERIKNSKYSRKESEDKKAKETYGTALIITGASDANSESDSRILAELFKGLRFNVKEHNLSNIGSDGWYPTLKKFRDEITSEDEAFVMFILRCPPALQSKELKSMFNGKNCPNLKLKPAIFFIQRSEPPALGGAGDAVDASKEVDADPIDQSERYTVTLNGIPSVNIIRCLVFTFADLVAYQNLEGLLYQFIRVVQAIRGSSEQKGISIMETDCTLMASQFYFQCS